MAKRDNDKNTSKRKKSDTARPKSAATTDRKGDKADKQIAKAEKRLVQALHSLEAARDELTTAERDLMDLLERHDRLPRQELSTTDATSDDDVMQHVAGDWNDQPQPES